jgi:hypothetical protein
MKNASVATILDEVSHLSFGEQEYLSDTLFHRVHEERRREKLFSRQH